MVDLEISDVREEVGGDEHVVSPGGPTGVGGNACEFIGLSTPYIGISPYVD